VPIRRLRSIVRRALWLTTNRIGSQRCQGPEDRNPGTRSDAPHFVILGTQRGGTTSLYRYLTAHPCVIPAIRKELHFFDSWYDRGPDWYRAQFPSRLPPGCITGEATPYYLFHPHAAERMRAHAPHAKLIVLLRNPIDRAYSHYGHSVRLGHEALPFEEAIARENARLQGETEKLIADGTYYSFNHQNFSYAARGRYVDQLQTWFSFFPREQFLILQSEELYRDPNATVQRVTDFLGLSAITKNLRKAHNVGSSSTMPQHTRELLAASFADSNRRLGEELGLDFTWIESS
jgi:hypothetical protein